MSVCRTCVYIEISQIPEWKTGDFQNIDVISYSLRNAEVKLTLYQLVVTANYLSCSI